MIFSFIVTNSVPKGSSVIAHHQILLSPEQKWHHQSLHLTIGSASAVQMIKTKSLTKKKLRNQNVPIKRGAARISCFQAGNRTFWIDNKNQALNYVSDS